MPPLKCLECSLVQTTTFSHENLILWCDMNTILAWFCGAIFHLIMTSKTIQERVHIFIVQTTLSSNEWMKCSANGLRMDDCDDIELL